MALMEVIDTFRLWDCSCPESDGIPRKMQRRSDLDVISVICPNYLSADDEHQMDILVGSYKEWFCNHCGTHQVTDYQVQEIMCGRCGSSIRAMGVTRAA